MLREPGWHPDPEGDGERWHNGSRWTGVTRPTAESLQRAATFEAVASRRRRRAKRLRRIRPAALAALSVVAALGLAAWLDPTETASVAHALGIDRPHRILPSVTPSVPSTSYSILQSDYNGQPVTYDPCKPVDYVIDPAGAPTDYMSFIGPAITKAQAATGLKFVFGGLSTDTSQSRQEATTSEPILISFPAALHSVSEPDAVGLGGSTSMALNGLKQPHYLTGFVELLSGWFAQKSAAHATAVEESVVMHELGHVLGLGHVHDRTQIMYPQAHGQTKYGAGDLAGLARLGDGGCAN